METEVFHQCRLKSFRDKTVLTKLCKYNAPDCKAIIECKWEKTKRLQKRAMLNLQNIDPITAV